MADGHSSGLPLWEAPVMIAEKRNLFFSFQEFNMPLHAATAMKTAV